MEIKISVPEVVNLIKELQEKPSRIFEMVAMNVQKDVGNYLTNLMKAELTHILGREAYERSKGDVNHRNGSYPRDFCIKGIGEVAVKVQRCQVHVARNVLAKVPHKLKKEVADDPRSIFYASSKEKADEFYKSFYEKWNKDIPSAVKSLTQSIDSCLTFFKFPEEEWISLRTTNIIERLNKEFKRRTKSMEIVAGENACYRLLAFISLKMELSWRSNPIGKVRPNLPLYQIYTK